MKKRFSDQQLTAIPREVEDGGFFPGTLLHPPLSTPADRSPLGSSLHAEIEAFTWNRKST